MPTKADRVQQGYYDRQLEAKAQEASAETKSVANGMRSGMWDWLRLIGLAVMIIIIAAVAFVFV